MSDNFQKEHNKKTNYYGNKYFFLNGRCSINAKPYCLMMTIMSLFYDYIHTFYYMNVYIKDDRILILIFIILSTLQMTQTLLTALIDPGSFVPQPKEAIDYSLANNGSLYATLDNGDTTKLKLKICTTCHIVRDLRVFHCSTCGLCILRHDHHCPWLSTCVGLNNHQHFIFLILINSVFFCFTLCFHTYMITKIYDFDLGVIDIMFIIFSIVMNSIFFSFQVVLIYNHTIYICTGETTREKLKRLNKNKSEPFINPFRTSCRIQNFKEFFFCPMRYKEHVIYSDKASKYLDTYKLINDELGGTYEIKDNKVMSETLIEKGYRYKLFELEMCSKTNDSVETSSSINDEKLDDDNNENKKVILIKSEN